MIDKPQPAILVVALAALLGLLFASVSTFDFAMHLDRQVHDVHCSFVPGLSGTERGESGCQVTLISAYSSVFRTRIWGGVPVALPGMGVFAFLLFFAAELVLTGRQRDPRAVGFLALATGVPALTSVVMGYIALVELDAVCKLCIGIYFASALALAGALVAWRRARRSPELPPRSRAVATAVRARPPRLSHRDHAVRDDPPWASGGDPAWTGPADDPREQPEEDEPSPPPEPVTRSAPALIGLRYLAAAVGVGVVFTVTPVMAYLVAAPDHGRFIGSCGALVHPKDDGVMVDLGRHPGGVPAVLVLDPLCPACRGFERRLAAAGLDAELDRRVLLFPLDQSCNWMVDSSVHPGACAVSEAMLCAGDRADDVLGWAFDHQEEIRDAAAKDPAAAPRLIGERFPELGRCVGSAEVRARLNRALRWAVQNQLPVLAPQLYLAGVKLCDEDVDLGLEFALTRMVSAFRNGTLQAEAGEVTP